MIKSIEILNNSVIINKRYQIYSDGVIYDTLKAKDIPQWLFRFRDKIIF